MLPHFIWCTFSCTLRLSRVWDSVWKMLPLHTQAQHNGLEAKFTDSGNNSHCVKTKSSKYWTKSCLQKNGHRFYFLLWKSGHTFPAPWRGARKSQLGEMAGERRLRTSESRGSCPLRITPARVSDEAASPSPPSGVSPSSDSQQHY